MTLTNRMFCMNIIFLTLSVISFNKSVFNNIFKIKIKNSN